jgi:hypothetical protein
MVVFGFIYTHNLWGVHLDSLVLSTEYIRGDYRARTLLRLRRDYLLGLF